VAGNDGDPPSHEEIRRRWAETYGRTPDARPPRSRKRLYGGVTVVVVLATALLFWRAGQAKPLSAANPTGETAQVDLSNPFGETPASNWGDGAAGIAPPTPTAVGGFTAQQVGDAENQVKQVLVAAHLDNRMLVDHDPSAYLALLSPANQDDARLEVTEPADNGGAVTLLKTGFHLLPAPIKVKGTMSASVEHDYLVVHTNYVFAFPFAPTDPATVHHPWQIVAVMHVQEDFRVVHGGYPARQQGVWAVPVTSYFSSMDCQAMLAGYLAPAYTHQRLYPNGSTQDPNAQLDPNQPLNGPDTCHTG
jgi:hypothetical protein